MLTQAFQADTAQQLTEALNAFLDTLFCSWDMVRIEYAVTQPKYTRMGTSGVVHCALVMWPRPVEAP